MNLQRRTNQIVGLVTYCKHCQPLSGCILSHLKGKPKTEIKAYLKNLSEACYRRILSYHESCPYRHSIEI